MLRSLEWLRIPRLHIPADALQLWFSFSAGTQVAATSLGCWGGECTGSFKVTAHCWGILNFLMFHWHSVRVFHQDWHIPCLVLWCNLTHVLVICSYNASHLIFRTILHSGQFSTCQVCNMHLAKTKYKCQIMHVHPCTVLRLICCCCLIFILF